MNRIRRSCALAAVAAAVGVLAAPLTAVAATSVTITEFSGTSQVPESIAAGPDGNMWFTESTGNPADTPFIGRITPAGVVTEFSAGITAGAAPNWIVAGPDGNMWFTEGNRAAIGRITPSGVVTEFTAGISNTTYAITAGPDGNLWFTEGASGGIEPPIGRITTAGVVTEFAAPMARYANKIVTGPDGNLWYISQDGIGQITPQGVATDFNAGFTMAPSRLATGPDGNIWFTEDDGYVGKMTTSGVVTLYSNGLDSGAEPIDITAGPDGAMWFTDWALDNGGPAALGRISTDGTITEYTAGITPGSGPQEIAAGPNGTLWFTESVGQQIARADISTTASGGGGGTSIAPASTPTARLSGPDRIGTAIAISGHEYPTAGSAHTVVLARADTFPDALAGGPLAASLGGPLLLTESNQLDPATLAEISRVLSPGGTVTLLGGTAGLSDTIAATLRVHGYQVVREAGVDRYATAAAIAGAVNDPKAVLLADGVGFADALSAGAAAAHLGGVVLLTNGSQLPAATASYLAAHSGVQVYAIGAPAAAALPSAIPVFGADRYATSVAVAQRFFLTPQVAGLADGLAFPDALAGSVDVGREGGPLLLVAPTLLPPGVQSYLSATPSIASLTVYGGTNAVGDQVVTEAGQ